MRYEVGFDAGALREFAKLPSSTKTEISKALGELSEEPRPYGSRKMAGMDAYRIRAGDYRAVYAVRDERLIVLVVWVGHRKEVYGDIGFVRRRLKG